MRPMSTGPDYGLTGLSGCDCWLCVASGAEGERAEPEPLFNAIRYGLTLARSVRFWNWGVFDHSEGPLER